MFLAKGSLNLSKSMLCLRNWKKGFRAYMTCIYLGKESRVYLRLKCGVCELFLQNVQLYTFLTILRYTVAFYSLLSLAKTGKFWVIYWVLFSIFHNLSVMELHAQSLCHGTLYYFPLEYLECISLLHCYRAWPHDLFLLKEWESIWCKPRVKMCLQYLSWPLPLLLSSMKRTHPVYMLVNHEVKT